VYESGVVCYGTEANLLVKVMFTVPISGERYKVVPDLGLGYLAALTRSAGHDVRFLDCRLEEYDYEDFERCVSKYRPDVLAIKLYSIDTPHVRKMINVVRQVSSDTVTVVGGPHPSTEKPERLFDQLPGLDYAFAGEGEPGFPSFLERLQSGSCDFDHIPGLIWRDSAGTARENQRTVVADLNALPFPAWDLIDPRRYRYGSSFMTSRYPAAPVAATRGCPYSCTFCGAHLISGHALRIRDVDNIVEEFRLLSDRYDVRSIDITDDNFTFSRDFVMQFCERLIQERLDIGWNCPGGVRLDKLDAEMVRTMERSGCFALSLGIESGSNRILKKINKNLTVETVVEQVRMIKNVSKIKLLGMFMMGFPDETREEIESTIDLACSLPLDLAAFGPLRVTPGTAIYADLVAAGEIEPEMDYHEFGLPIFSRSYSRIPDDELFKLFRKAYSSFYFRPKIFLSLLSKVRTWSQVRDILDGLSRTVRRRVL